MCVCFTWRLCYWIWPHTHSIWSSDRIHSFTFIYIHKQVFMRPLEERVYLILPTINSALFQCMIHGLQSSGVPKQKRKTIGENWYKRTQLPKKYHSDHSKRKKRRWHLFFSDSPFLFFCYVYTFSVGVKLFSINIRMECREKWEEKNRIDRNKMKIYWYDAQNWPTLFLQHFQYCTKYESYKIK